MGRTNPRSKLGTPLEHLTKPKSDQSDSKGEKSQMDISSAFISDEQAPVSMEPGKGSLNNPAVLSKMRGTVHPTSGNAVLYMSHCARLSAKRKIVPFISVKFLRTTSGSPVQISQGRQMIQHIFQHFAIIHIGGSEADNKRNAIAIRYEMMFASRTTSIYGVGSCVFAPLFAWMTEPSIQALLQSIFFVCLRRGVCRQDMVTRLSQTPASCQSRSLRQQVMPLPQPISCGRSSHGIPVLSTKTIPVKAARSGLRGRPPLGVGLCFPAKAVQSDSTVRRLPVSWAFCFTPTGILLHIPLFVRFC